MSAGSVAVVDAWAALAFLRREGSADTTMRRYLKRAHRGNLRLLMNLVNLGEVYYRMIQLAGAEDADEWLRLFRQLPIEMVPVREPLAMEAGRVKAQHRISFADAFAVATARLEGGTVLTGDPEILALPRDVVRVVKLER
jgi:predicted nucleic acid-binding protein